MGGATPAGFNVRVMSRGLSPRGRGNHGPASAWAHFARSIPAWAGQPWTCATAHLQPAVYPRVGGATRVSHQAGHRRRGLSPRGRGNPACETLAAELGGSIPAWAGQPDPPPLPLSCNTVYPRVGGATEVKGSVSIDLPGLSPRGRGNLLNLHQFQGHLRSIPAWAGQPDSASREALPKAVYPRVGGATSERSNVSESSMGLSPRGRGNPISPRCPRCSVRSIPAWAGQPIRAQPIQEPV